MAAGVVDVDLTAKMYDSTTGLGKTGLVAADFTVYYHRQGAASTVQIAAIDLASLGASHSDGGVFEKNSTNMKGSYRFCSTDAAFASGSDCVEFEFQATGCKPYSVIYNIDPFAVDANGLVKLQPVVHTGATIPIVTSLSGHTAQSGDGYAILNNATYGNAKLVRSTTPANTLTVSAANEAKVDGILFTLSSTERENIADAFLARTLGTESYATLAAIPTVKQALYQILATPFHTTSGLTVTFYKLNMSTPAFTATLSPNATNPTSHIKAS